MIDAKPRFDRQADLMKNPQASSAEKYPAPNGWD
jgi:hypothetical protein